MTGVLRRTCGAALTILLGATTNAAAQSMSPADGWSGQVQCVLSVRGIGYEDDQTQT